MCVYVSAGPKAIGVFHEALSSHYRHLFNYLAQLFTQAGLDLPPKRRMKGKNIQRMISVGMSTLEHSFFFRTLQKIQRM